MGITLFKHNIEAYSEVKVMLETVGKAAVIHPTGTGKSFIAFKLCEDNPSKRICWLSPSEYIFKTQIENLKSVTGGYVPENIFFLTYAKLMFMNKAEIGEIKPDYIILDEFHRCGAEQWGRGVDTLLTIYEGVPILGLSATAIRYLDNQRDMSDELFDGNIASVITLGEAIVRGILNPPKYILSVFSYQKDLEKYQRRIRHTKNNAVRDTAEQYLEALRRALDKADGLDLIFDRHMTDRHGKYIVFCASYEHLCEMKTHTEWFAKIDKNPHIYTVYTEDPSASKSFQKFKEDNDTTHLRLLFVIDALNEGIHMDDISGVILLRPTVSPIVYKQQIGRAMSASKSKDTIIFDIVNNIENLTSIDSIEEEMQNAVLYFRKDGFSEEIVNEHFRIMDELHDCRELFDRLNETLSSSWDIMYEYAKQFYNEHNHLDVPKRYRTIDGYSLGSWIVTQRRVHSGEIAGRLTRSQIERLNSIGMKWDSRADVLWKQGYTALVKYKEEYGDLDIKSDYMTEGGFPLGKLVSNIRSAKTQGRRSAFLTPDHEKMLSELGFIWDRLDYAWEQYFIACAKFRLEHGHLKIPSSAVTEDGLAIGAWVCRQRMIRDERIPGRLTNIQIQRLDEIGFEWDNHYMQQWNTAYKRLSEYYRENGHVNVPVAYVDATGFALGKWVRRQKDNTKLSLERKTKLISLGVSFEKDTDPWEIRYTLAEQYYREHGDLNVPSKYTVDGIWLNKWLNEQRQIYIGNRKGKNLTDEQISRLTAIGMVWENRKQVINETLWNERYTEIKQFYDKNGHLNVPVDYRSANGKQLSLWMSRQRKAYKAGNLAEDKAKLLRSVGIV